MKEVEYDKPIGKEYDSHARSRGSTKAPTVRTFRTDVQELIQEKGTTKTQIIMAEEARRERRGEPRLLEESDDSHFGRIIFLLTLILAFALGIGAYVLLGTKTSLPFISQKTAPEVKPITTDTAQILITNSPREQILADLSITFGKTSLLQDQTREVVFNVKESNGETRPATTAELLSALSLQIPPDEFLRSLSDTPHYGIYSKEKLTGYLQISSRSYPNTFSGILEWEPRMFEDLTPVLNPWYDRKNISTLRDREFKDERIGTIDARVLRDPEGNTVLAYAFANKETLVISNSTDTLLTLVTKLEQPQ